MRVATEAIDSTVKTCRSNKIIKKIKKIKRNKSNEIETRAPLDKVVM